MRKRRRKIQKITTNKNKKNEIKSNLDSVLNQLVQSHTMLRRQSLVKRVNRGTHPSNQNVLNLGVVSFIFGGSYGRGEGRGGRNCEGGEIVRGEGRRGKGGVQTTKEEVDKVVVLEEGGDLRVTTLSLVQDPNRLIGSPKKKKSHF